MQPDNQDGFLMSENHLSSRPPTLTFSPRSRAILPLLFDSSSFSLYPHSPVFLSCTCVCVSVCCWPPILPPPATRLRRADPAHAEDQGQAWNCIRETPGLYVPLLSSHFPCPPASLLPICFVCWLRQWPLNAVHHPRVSQRGDASPLPLCASMFQHTSH